MPHSAKYRVDKSSTNNGHADELKAPRDHVYDLHRQVMRHRRFR
jgi:hypothetical protein